MVSTQTAIVYGLVAAQAAAGVAGNALGVAGPFQGTGGAIVVWALGAAIAYMAEAFGIRIAGLVLMGLAEGVIFAAGIPRGRWWRTTGALAGVTIAGLALGAYIRQGGVVPWWLGLPVLLLFGATAAYVRYWQVTDAVARWVVPALGACLFFYETVRVTVAADGVDAVQGAVRLSATGMVFSWGVGGL